MKRTGIIKAKMRINQKSIHKFTEKLSKFHNLQPDIQQIFNINSEQAFNKMALEIFRFQYHNNTVYKSWVDLLKVDPASVHDPEQIPFLPIEFFKSNEVIASEKNENTVVFTSSSTTSQTPSKHFVNEIGVYETSFFKGFELFYGQPSDYCILALLPNYLERGGSSLVYMFDQLIRASGHALGGFFGSEFGVRGSETVQSLGLTERIELLKKQKQKTLLIGVSYALMDLSEKVKLDSNFIVMETGGMKGKRKELLKEELHAYLKKGFGIPAIHSEYGMTELLSQAYSRADGIFHAPPWMKFLVREVTDPLSIRHDSKTGGLCVIDLANVYSCSFIATKDLGRVEGNTLQLMGRYDNSDVRGCNLMLG